MLLWISIKWAPSVLQRRNFQPSIIASELVCECLRKKCEGLRSDHMVSDLKLNVQHQASNAPLLLRVSDLFLAGLFLCLCIFSHILPNMALSSSCPLPGSKKLPLIAFHRPQAFLAAIKLRCDTTDERLN